MTTWLKGVDASYDTLTEKKAKDLWGAGYRVFMQCLWTGVERPGPAIANLQMARDKGFMVCGYVSVTGHNPGAWHAAHGREGVPDDLWADLALVPVDVELPDIPKDTIRGCVEALYAAGKRRAIYTAWFAWVGQQGDPQDFTDCMLLNAFWDEDEDFDFVHLPFGGWTPDQVVCEQYTGGGDVNGLNADKDQWNEELLLRDLLEREGRVKYTDEVLNGVFGSMLTTLGNALDLANTAGNAISHHVNTHPGGGPTITTAHELEELNAKINANEAELAAFKAAVAVAAGATPDA